MPLPQSFYTSTSTQALQMLDLTYSDLPFRAGQIYEPKGSELLREKSQFEEAADYGEESLLSNAERRDEQSEGGLLGTKMWRFKVSEMDDERNRRMRLLLDEIFENDQNTFISVNGPSKLIAALLRIIGHQHFQPTVGNILPVLIKAESV
ncbi:MAG: hypothetical protein M1818_000521 [Claussenomyces sp. TS43310]|nr:MAG: hypothetical protein M1818_000521 [Claussenomyces sp. TS43310]